MIENLNARLLVAKNNPQAAGKQYEAALKIYPDNRALNYGYADHLLAIKQADSAINLVKIQQKLYPNDAQFYQVLAKAYTMQNKLLLGYQAQGESYFRKYDLTRAIEQMELATKANDGDFYQKSIVEARLKEMRRMQGDVKKS
jgi:predicted Zn-dependent protease